MIKENQTNNENGFNLAGYKHEITKAIVFAKEKKQVDVFWRQLDDNSALIAIIQDKSGNSIHFVEVVTRKTIKPKDLGQSTFASHQWELVIDAPKVTPDEAARFIFNFLRDFYDQIEGLPVNFYQSLKHFKHRQMLAAYKINNLVSKVA